MTIFIACLALPLFMCTGMLYIIIITIVPSKRFYATNLAARFILFFLGAKMVINKPFPGGGPYFVMYNHTSFIDAFVFFSFASGKFTGIAAKKNFKIPIFGWMAKKFKAIPIERGNLKSSIKSLEKAEKRLKEGYHICILPEGTRSLDGKMLEFKKGGFHMAINTKAQILPIGISGAFTYKPKNRWFLKPGPVHVNIGDPIDASQYSIDSIQDLINTTYQHINSLSKFTDNV